MFTRMLLAVAILVPFIPGSEARAQFEGPTAIKIGVSPAYNGVTTTKTVAVLKPPGS